MNAPRHDLDAAIDRVATKMVAIDDDARVLQGVLSRLPDRASRPWFLGMPVQATVAVALVAAAFQWARPSEPPATPIAIAPIHSIAPPVVTGLMVVPTDRRADIHLRQGSGGQARLPPSPRLRRANPTPAFAEATAGKPDSRVGGDHERSLPPVAAIEAIELGEISAPAIELDAPALLEPLVLTDLSLEIKGDS